MIVQLVSSGICIALPLWVKLFRVGPELGVVVEQVNGNAYH